MIIKLTAINDTKLGKSPAKEVVGTKVVDGSPWKKAFFANQKELRDALEDFQVGDVVNVVMEQKGDFWNISGFKEVTDDDIAKAVEGKKKFSGGSGGTGVRRPDGGSRGDDTNRSAAIYLAREIMKMSWESQDEPTYTSPEAFSLRCISLANDFILPFIKDGVVPSSAKPAGKAKKGSADPLTPPEVDND